MKVRCDLEAGGMVRGPGGEQECGPGGARRKADERALVENAGKLDLGRVVAVSGGEVTEALEMAESKGLLFARHPGDHLLDEGFEEEVFAHESAVFVTVRVEGGGHLLRNSLVFLSDLPRLVVCELVARDEALLSPEAGVSLVLQALDRKGGGIPHLECSVLPHKSLSPGTQSPAGVVK